jgi:hypothetical protein
MCDNCFNLCCPGCSPYDKPIQSESWPVTQRQVDWSGIREYLAGIETSDPEASDEKR